MGRQVRISAGQDDGVSEPAYLSRQVCRFPEIRRSGVWCQVRPQRVDDLFAAEPVPRCKRQQLNELHRSGVAPAVVRDDHVVDGDDEVAEEMKVDDWTDHG